VSWEADWEIIIAAIARETLSGGALAPNHDASFPRKVRNRVMELIKSAFADTRIRISDISPHVSLEFLTTEGTSFGRIGSVGCGYGSSPGAVNLGYFKKSMTDHLDDWVPMNLSDSSDLRAEDIAFALADTAIHEISHSLGLVVCDWMGDDYSDHGHNPPSSLDLFGYGGYRMDSGGRVKKYRRLGYENASQHRTAVRILRSLNSLNASYIGKVYGDD